jgi:predicted amidohydrolase YtcJ
VRRVAERVRGTPAGGWVRGAGWDQHLWPGARFPSRHDLDAVSPEHPVVLIHTSGHCVWTNSAALRAAGVTATTAAPFGGAIDHDDAGEPTGILRDAASALVYDAMPKPSRDDRAAAVREAIAHANALGLSGAHAMDVSRGELAALRALNDAGELTLRTRVFLSSARLEEWLGNERTGGGDEMLSTGGVKFFSDGALGSLTAWMLEPYEGSDDRGLPLWEPAELERAVRSCLEHGLAPAVHAIGDAANRAVLDIMERTRSIAPELPRRIEHAQLLSPQDVARFGAQGVTASAQPIHATQDMAKVDRCWGDRGRVAYAFASLLAGGANLAFGSDTPVETMSPFAGLHAAVTRQNARGEPATGWYPGERLSIEQALRAYTTGCAAAAGEVGRAGRIAAGCAADFVVLSRDIFAEEPAALLETQAEMTVVGGRVAFRR